jgi:hypothetical protein
MSEMWLGYFYHLNWLITKDAGFVHESFQNETNQIFWDFWPYELNPRFESFKNRSTKRIHIIFII